ncbi:MAG: T9SS type A sorting domain-containing protein [Ignavibacteriaceae bacterium]|nr:T9SS type A sorting domain-containing protein [Ignavibacteriaceae bacterium]
MKNIVLAILFFLPSFIHAQNVYINAYDSLSTRYVVTTDTNSYLYIYRYYNWNPMPGLKDSYRFSRINEISGFLPLGQFPLKNIPYLWGGYFIPEIDHIEAANNLTMIRFDLPNTAIYNSILSYDGFATMVYSNQNVPVYNGFTKGASFKAEPVLTNEILWPAIQQLFFAPGIGFIKMNREVAPGGVNWRTESNLVMQQALIKLPSGNRVFLGQILPVTINLGLPSMVSSDSVFQGFVKLTHPWDKVDNTNCSACPQVMVDSAKIGVFFSKTGMPNSDTTFYLIKKKYSTNEFDVNLKLNIDTSYLNNGYGFKYFVEAFTKDVYMNRKKFPSTNDYSLNFQPIVSVKETVGSPDNYSLSVYPNPFNDKISLAINFPPSNTLFMEIYDILGNKIMDKEFNNGISEYNILEVDILNEVPSLSNGVYILKMIDKETNFVKTKKIVFVK